MGHTAWLSGRVPLRSGTENRKFGNSSELPIAYQDENFTRGKRFLGSAPPFKLVASVPDLAQAYKN